MPGDDHSRSRFSAGEAIIRAVEGPPALVLAVSGGPDSVALMWLAARWRRGLKRGPRLIAVTIDHGLRTDAAREARDVKRLAKSLDLEHRTLRWTGAKPKTGLPAAAREARYALLAKVARTQWRHAHRDRAYQGRPGRDAADAAAARQRRRGPCRHGARERARRRAAGAAAAGNFQGAAHRDAGQGPHRLCRRSDQSRSRVHPSAAARVDAGARGGGRRCAQSGAAGVAAGARQCRRRGAGRRRRALSDV